VATVRWHLEAQRVLAPRVALEVLQRALDDATVGVAGPQPQRRRFAADAAPGGQLHPLSAQRRRVDRSGQPAPGADLGVPGRESQRAAAVVRRDDVRRYAGPAQRPALQRGGAVEAVLAGGVARHADLAGQIGRGRRGGLAASGAHRQRTESDEGTCTHHRAAHSYRRFVTSEFASAHLLREGGHWTGRADGSPRSFLERSRRFTLRRRRDQSWIPCTRQVDHTSDGEDAKLRLAGNYSVGVIRSVIPVANRHCAIATSVSLENVDSHRCRRRSICAALRLRRAIVASLPSPRGLRGGRGLLQWR
jgi:hypothetical protein